MTDVAKGAAPVAPPDGLLTRAPALDRRRVLALALHPRGPGGGFGSCVCAPPRRAKGPDPLIALADAARGDAELAAAAIAANPDLAARVEPLRAARTEHATAFDAEVVRLGGAPRGGAPTASAVPSADPTAAPTGAARPVTLARVRDAVAASQRGAAQLVPDLPAERVGLVASVAACCATYVGVLV